MAGCAFAGRWPCDTVTKQPRHPPTTASPLWGDPLGLRPPPAAPRNGGGGPRGPLQRRTPHQPWREMHHPPQGHPRAPPAMATLLGHGAKSPGVWRPATLLPAAFPAGQPSAMPAPLATTHGLPCCSGAMGTPRVTPRPQNLPEGWLPSSMAVPQFSHLCNGARLLGDAWVGSLQPPGPQTPPLNRSGCQHRGTHPAQPLTAAQLSPHIPKPTRAPTSTPWPREPQGLTSSTMRGHTGPGRGEDLAAPSPLDTGISWAQCQNPAVHTQALPPKPPNSRATQDAHAVAQPGPTAPFIFGLLRHGFPAACPKCCQGTRWDTGSETPCPAPAALRVIPCTSRASVSPLVTFAHQPCDSTDASQPCPPYADPEGFLPLIPSPGALLNLPGGPRILPAN